MDKDNTTAHVSNEYDEQIRNTIPYYDAIHKETIELVRAYCPGPEIWLDTGCGTGTLIAKVYEEFPGTEFYLTDPSAAMLEKAKEKMDEKKYKRIHFLPLSGSESLEWKEKERPDVITAIQAHHYFDREGRKRAVKNCYSILKDKGLFITFENIRPASPAAVDLGMKRWKAFQIERGKTSSAVEAHLARFDREFFPVTIKEHLDLLNDTGFKTVELFWYSVMQAGFYAIKLILNKYQKINR
jgi:tRNA (cmo5U34)-methyltransferase